MRYFASLIVFSLFFTSCQHKISKDEIAKLNGYWQIEKVMTSDGEQKDYQANTSYDYFEIKADKGHLQFFQNGHQVIETHLWDEDWKDLVANSKFKDMPGFGSFHKGHIAFQGTENGKLWFRNIKIKKL